MRNVCLAAILSLVLAIGLPVQAKRMYEAQTTVMDMHAHLENGDREMHMSDLQELAKSQTVLTRTADTLIRLQVTQDPFIVLSTLEVEPVKDTNILAITVQAESEDLAKATADIIACEFVRYYDEFTKNKSGKPALKILEPAKTRHAPSHFEIFGLGPTILAYIAGILLVGIIIGIPIGILIAKRSVKRLPPPAES